MKYLRKLHIQLVEGEYKNPVQGQVRTPEQLYKVFKAIKDSSQETLIGVFLSDKLEVNAYDTLSIGGRSVTLVLPDEIFDRAIVTRSRYIILIHNHPSGDPTPSAEDTEVMETIKQNAQVLRRNLLDFIIVGDNQYWSMFEEAEGGEYSLGPVD